MLQICMWAPSMKCLRKDGNTLWGWQVKVVPEYYKYALYFHFYITFLRIKTVAHLCLYTNLFTTTIHVSLLVYATGICITE
jgi:hypothetical protein